MLGLILALFAPALPYYLRAAQTITGYRLHTVTIVRLVTVIFINSTNVFFPTSTIVLYSAISPYVSRVYKVAEMYSGVRARLRKHPCWQRGSPMNEPSRENGIPPGLSMFSEEEWPDASSVLSVAEVIALEKHLVAQGFSLFGLMKKAGGSVSGYVIDRFTPASPVVIFCGSGNNGGDGWVIASDLALAGYPVTLITSRSAQELTAEPALSAALKTTSANHALLHVVVNPTKEQLTALIHNAEVIIDALLGIGFKGSAIKEPYGSWIETINSAKKRQTCLRVVAVDIPSGLSADTGEAAQPCIAADTTITMLAYKPGLLLASSKKYCGLLYLARITD